MAAQMILALSIIVGIHEFGHLLTAKLFGMRVEKYFIGFPPKIWSFNYKGTEYGLGSIPLGGFVKISGIIDESMDTSHINKEPESWEFRSKPAWQRLVVMLGGIIFNVITGLIIFTMITFNNGETYLSKDEINKNGILALELGLEAGFKTGDKILLINDKEWERDAELFDPNLFFDDNSTFTVSRDNQEFKITIPDNFINKMNSREAMSSFIKARTPFSIDIRPRIIEDAKILVNVEIVNHVGRPVDYLEGFLSEFSGEQFLGEKRMVLIYHYEPALQTGFSTTKSATFELKGNSPSSFEFNISKVKFDGENRVFAWHPKSGFIRID